MPESAGVEQTHYFRINTTRRETKIEPGGGRKTERGDALAGRGMPQIACCLPGLATDRDGCGSVRRGYPDTWNLTFHPPEL